MDIEFIIFSLGTIPILASRGALPIFVSALIARFGTEWAWLAERGAFQYVASLPEWLTSDVALGVLGLVAALEFLVTRSADAREAIGIGEAELKGIISGAFTLLMIIGLAEKAGVTSATEENGIWSFESLWAAGIGFAVWKTAALRRAVLGFYDDLDPDDDFGVRRLFHALETLLGGFGPFLVIILPLLALFAAGATVLGLRLLQGHFTRLEAKRQITCECGARHHRGALACPECGRACAAPEAIGLFGQAKGKPAASPETHRHALLAKSRCGRCAERLKSPQTSESCPRCGDRHFPTPESTEDYRRRQTRRLPAALLISGLFGLIPIVGVIPGLIYYRLHLVSGLRGWLPRGSAFIGRWTIRLLALFLIPLQAFPLIGALSLPILCLLNFGVYGSRLKRAFNS